MRRVSHDALIDKKIGLVIRVHRVKLAMNQTDLGTALGVSFQQIQKYENGKNAIASTRIDGLCRTLKITPNELFATSAKMGDEATHLESWGMKTALQLQELLPAGRQAITALLEALPKRSHSPNRKR
jgi:DNA-binding Xre family transcriptional regulator